MFHWFRRFLPNQLLASTSDVSEALRAASQYADSDAIRLEYTAAADALDRAILHAKRYGSKSERDAVTYALGRAQINVRAQMTELIETSKEIHILMQDVHQEQGVQGAAVGELRAEFHDGMQSIGERLTDVEGRLAGVEKRMDASEADRKDLRQLYEDTRNEGRTERTQLGEHLDRLELEVRGALSRALAPERVAELIEMIERHEKILGGNHHEAGS